MEAAARGRSNNTNSIGQRGAFDDDGCEGGFGRSANRGQGCGRVTGILKLAERSSVGHTNKDPLDQHEQLCMRTFNKRKTSDPKTVYE